MGCRCASVPPAKQPEDSAWVGDFTVPPRSSTAAWPCRRSPRSRTSPRCCPGSFCIASSGRRRIPSAPCASSSSSRAQRRKVGKGSGVASAQGPAGPLPPRAVMAGGVVDRVSVAPRQRQRLPRERAHCASGSGQWRVGCHMSAAVAAEDTTTRQVLMKAPPEL